MDDVKNGWTEEDDDFEAEDDVLNVLHKLHNQPVYSSGTANVRYINKSNLPIPTSFSHLLCTFFFDFGFRVGRFTSESLILCF